MFPTSVIGSYPKPKWLLRTLSNPKASKEEKAHALDDAVRLVIKEQELAGVDIPSDGEMRRVEMTEYFTERIGGFVFKGPVRVWGNNYFNKAAVVSKVYYIQIYEPAISTHPEEVPWAIEVLNEVVKGISGVKFGVHICYGNYRALFPYILDAKVDQFALEFTNRRFRDLDLLKEYSYDKELGLGVIDVHNSRVETVEEVK